MAAITNIRRNIMGTTSFDARFPGMAKSQDFIVYPIRNAETKIAIQSDNRFGYIDMESGAVELAKGGQYTNAAIFTLAKMRGTLVKDQLTPEQLAELRTAIGQTAGPNVGERGVYSDNIGAAAIGGLGGAAPASGPQAESRVRRFVHGLLEDDGALEPVAFSRIKLNGSFFNLTDGPGQEIEWRKVSATTGKPVDPQAVSDRIQDPQGTGQFSREGYFVAYEMVRPKSAADLK